MTGGHLGPMNQTQWEQAAITKRWLSQSGPLYQDMSYRIASEEIRADILRLRLSYASSAIVKSAVIGDMVLVKERIV